jgi:hypothetical protein
LKNWQRKLDWTRDLWITVPVLFHLSYPALRWWSIYIHKFVNILSIRFYFSSGTPKKFDPTFKGPIANRGCTDVICCLLFIAFICGMGVVGYFGYRDGNPFALVYPTDSRGQICGVSTAVKDKPYLMFFDLLTCVASPYTTLLEFKCPTTQICVASCPNETFAALTQIPIAQVSPQLVEWDKFICDYDFNPQTEFTVGSYVSRPFSHLLLAYAGLLLIFLTAGN